MDGKWGVAAAAWGGNPMPSIFRLVPFTALIDMVLRPM